MENNPTVTFEDWIYLQKCLKYEKLRITHDEKEKRELLGKMDELHKEYYREQLSYRRKLKERDRMSEREDKKYRLETESQSFLGDHFRYAEQLSLRIRTNPDIFYYIAGFLRQKTPQTESLVESIGFSFFVDLVHPENNEQDLLSVIHKLTHKELQSLRGTGHVSNILKSNFLLDRLLYLYTKRKNQRKYMKLVFKRQMRDLLIDQEDIKKIDLNPGKIYEGILILRKRMSVPAIQETKGKEKRSFFRKKEKRKTEVFQPAFTIDEALADPEVDYHIESMSHKLTDDCKAILEEVYNNVATMPYGIRGICLKLIEQIQEVVPEASESEIFKLLGNILFYIWWFPAILDPVNHDLVSNFVIQPDTSRYLVKIVTVLKHICNNTRHAEKGYHYVNNFIESQVPRMDEYFRKLVTVADPMASCAPLYASFILGEVEELRNDNSLNMTTKTQKHIEHMNEITRFKIVTVVLNLHDLLFLSEMIVEHGEEINNLGWKDLVRYSQNLISAKDNHGLLEKVGAAEKVFLYFCKKEWGESFDMESSYLASLTQPPSFIDKNLRPIEVKLLVKCQEVIRNLLINLDLSIFFDPGRDWNFIEIVEFVIQCSYLFENKKENNSSIPIKLLAQFLATYMPKLPHKYRIDNFLKLFRELINDTEQRFQNVRKDANKNKKVLLLAINFIEKNVKDIKNESKVQESAKRKLNFQDFIKTQEIPACILNKRENDNYFLQVLSVTECPHSRVAYAQDLIRGRISMIEEQKHVHFIDDFIQAFVKRDEVVQCCEYEEDNFRVSDAFFSYIDLVHHQLANVLRSEEEVESTLEEIEKYITSSMYKKIFPDKPSVKDSRLYEKTLELEWVKPEHLEIAPDQRNEDMWTIAIQQLSDINKEKTPAQKLDCLEKCMNIIVNVLSLVSSGSGVGADDSLPIIIYVVIKAQPKRLYSNLNYTAKFRHPNKMIGLKGFVFQQFQSAATFIESIDEKALTVDSREYFKNCEESRLKLFKDKT